MALMFLPVCVRAARVADGCQNTLTPAEKKAGWKLLFDGKTTKGWHRFKCKTLGDNWKVVDGALTRVAEGGDIVSDERFDNFELSLDYKIAKGGNSGIMFRISENFPKFAKPGPEVQIIDNDFYKKKLKHLQKAGWLYQLYKSEVDATKPAGQWNNLRMVIRQNPEKSEVYINGVKYYDFVIGSSDWDRRVAKAKFTKSPLFGRIAKGPIELQDHHSLVAFRNIKIRPLPAK